MLLDVNNVYAKVRFPTPSSRSLSIYDTASDADRVGQYHLAGHSNKGTHIPGQPHSDSP